MEVWRQYYQTLWISVHVSSLLSTKIIVSWLFDFFWLKLLLSFFSRSNHVYYENRVGGGGDWELPGNSPCAAASTPGIKDWNLLEAHLYNEAYHKRTALWIFNPYVKPHFKFINYILRLFLYNKNKEYVQGRVYLCVLLFSLATLAFLNLTLLNTYSMKNISNCIDSWET